MATTIAPDDAEELRLAAAFRAALPWLPEPLGVVSPERAQTLLDLNGFSVAFVATVLGVSDKTVRRWLAAEVGPCHQYGPRWQRLLGLLEQRLRIAGLEADEQPNPDDPEKES